MDLTQNKIVANQLPYRKKYVKLEVLESDTFKTLTTIEGQVISGSLTKDANSVLRRSGSLQIAIPKWEGDMFIESLQTYTISEGGIFWIDRAIRVSIGIENYQEQGSPIVWNDFGICLIDAPQKTISGSQYEISFNLIDLMARLTGDRQGQLTGIGTVIPMVEYDYTNTPPTYTPTLFKDSLISVLTEIGNVKNYSIAEIPDDFKYLPYDIKVEVGATVYDIIEEYMNILSTWQIYYDNSGVLIIEPIPSGENDIVYPDIDEYETEETVSYEFNNVKNQVVVYGRENTLHFYADTATYQNNTLILKFPALDMASITVRGTNFGFNSPLEYNPQLNKVQIFVGESTEALVECDLVGFENTQNYVAENTIEPSGVYYIRIFSANLSTVGNVVLSSAIFEYMGKQQVSYTLVEDDINSDFYVNKEYSDQNIENYYAGMAYGNGVDYKLTLNNNSSISSFGNNAIITFMPNITNYGNILDKEQNYGAGGLVAHIQRVGGYIYQGSASMGSGKNILKIDADTLEILLSIETNQRLQWDMCNDGRYIYTGENDLIVYDTTTDTYTSIDLALGSNNRISTLCTDGVNVYIVSFKSTLYIYNISSGTLSDTSYPIPSIDYSGAVVTSVTNGEKVFLPNFTTNEVYVFDIASTQYDTNIQLGNMTGENRCLLYKDILYLSDGYRLCIFNITMNTYDIISLPQNIGKGTYRSAIFKNENMLYLGGDVGLFVQYDLDRNLFLPTITLWDTIFPASGIDDIYDILYIGDVLYAISSAQLAKFTPQTTISVVDGVSGVVLYQNIPLKQNTFITNNGETYRPSVEPNKLSNDYTIWAIQYDSTRGEFVLLGRNPYVYLSVFSGGEYDNIYADRLAYERCVWELYKHSNLNDTFSIGIVPNYALDVNMKIAHNPAIGQNDGFSILAGADDYVLKSSDNYFLGVLYYEYGLIKEIEYPLGISNTPQSMTAIRLFNSKLLGS